MALWNPFNLFKRKEKPAPSEPVPSEPVPSEPVPSEPAPSEPVPSEPAPSEPAPSEPAPSEPAPSEPAPSEPAPSEPAPSELGPLEPVDAAAPVIAPQPTADLVAAPPQPAEPDEPASTLAPPTIAEDGPRPPGDSMAAANLGEGTSDNQPNDSPLTPAAEVPATEAKHLPFVEQRRPVEPVDLGAKISRRPTTAATTAPAAEPEAAGGLFGWFRAAVRKTAQVLNTDIRDLVGKDGRLVDEEFLKELFTHLIKTDMGVASATEIRDAIHADYRGRKVQLAELIHAAKVTIRRIMQQEEVRLTFADEGTSVIMVVGVNGSGKTTSIAKLANLFRQDGKSVVLGAGDTFRAAAVEQLRQWAGRIGAEIVTGEDRSDPASVAYRAVKRAVEVGADVCIVDTAGRLQTQSHLMQELAKIRRVIDKVVPGAPHETLLVLDSTAGQNAISQARGFSQAAGCTGIVLAKLDGTAKGGVAIPIRKEFDLPVKFIGFGETADAIAPFDVDRYVDALFNVD